MGRRGAKLGLATAALVLLASCQPVKLPTKPAPPARMLLPPPPDLPAPPNSPGLNGAGTDFDFVPNLSNPWDIAFVPGDANTMFITERAGPISVVLSGGAPAALFMPTGLAATGEAGLMGIAVHPGFAPSANRFLYVCYSTATDNRVVRYAVGPAPGFALSGETPIVTGIPVAGSHDGCRVRFGPDGNLWVTTGDAAFGPGPQSLTSHAGKVLRMTPAGGEVAGNVVGLIYTYGHRNVQGLAFRPGTGVPYSTEHGPDKNDEVNPLVAGGNGGWDPNANGGYDQGVPMTDLVKFPNAMIPAWRSGDPFTLAPSGATFLSGAQWKAWDGALAVAFLKDSAVRIMFLDGDGNVSFATRVLAMGTRLRSVVQGPDGNLYIATDVPTGGGEIWKVVPN